MTVWAKLQSWLGAVASDVAIDNEFNNIYLGLNEAANGNLPSGYNKVDLTFTGASLTIKGETKIGNVNVALDSILTVSGVAGWRYIVTTNGGVMSVEAIPPAEITADTQQYTPTPVFNTSDNGYYSTVNTARRIVGVCYFDTTIKEVIAYGIGKRKNDDYWYNNTNTTSTNTPTNRLQITTAFNYSRGTNITGIDQGVGTTDSEGYKIQANKTGFILINATIQADSIVTLNVRLHKNGALYSTCMTWETSIGLITSIGNRVSYRIPVQKNDYFVFNAHTITNGSCYISELEIGFEEV